MEDLRLIGVGALFARTPNSRHGSLSFSLSRLIDKRSVIFHCTNCWLVCYRWPVFFFSHARFLCHLHHLSLGSASFILPVTFCPPSCPTWWGQTCPTTPVEVVSARADELLVFPLLSLSLSHTLLSLSLLPTSFSSQPINTWTCACVRVCRAWAGGTLSTLLPSFCSYIFV